MVQVVCKQGDVYRKLYLHHMYTHAKVLLVSSKVEQVAFYTIMACILTMTYAWKPVKLRECGCMCGREQHTPVVAIALIALIAPTSQPSGNIYTSRFLIIQVSQKLPLDDAVLLSNLWYVWQRRQHTAVVALIAQQHKPLAICMEMHFSYYGVSQKLPVDDAVLLSNLWLYVCGREDSILQLLQ